MSSRTIRKLFGTTNLPPLEGNSDEEFEPLYAKDTNSKFSGLVLSSQSESEQEVPESLDDTVKPEGEEKKKKKKKKKSKQRRTKAAPIINNNGDGEMDEIDKSVMEVNAILGSPPPVTPNVRVEKKVDPVKLLLSVQAKHLDYNNELKRIFGSESLDYSRGKKCRPHNVVKYRRGAIVPIPENRHYTSVGLSMSLYRRENDPRSYFTFDHNREYQKMHQLFLGVHGREDALDDSRRNTHIEGLLQTADYMFRSEEYTAANNVLEQIISYMHYIAHPCFNLTDQSIRLEYKYMENRPFHIAVLKYCHMLTNKACHRTALELAKLLLNLDPSDPLAVIYIIDTIALRAREHQWLIDAIDYWKKERDAGYLFNIQYSYAMAHYHVAKKNKTNDYSRADELIQEAMLHYPTLAVRLFENCKQDSTNVTTHPYFSLTGEEKFPEKIKTAMILHSKLVCWRWREPDVMQWFLRNANELVDKLNNDPAVKLRGEQLSKQRHQLYAACPEQILRHLSVVRPMTNLLVEWELPQMTRQFSWDPLPPSDGINRYDYDTSIEVDPRYYSGLFNIFARFLGPGQLYPAEWRDQQRAPDDNDPPQRRGDNAHQPAQEELDAADNTNLENNSFQNTDADGTRQNNTLNSNGTQNNSSESESNLYSNTSDSVDSELDPEEMPRYNHSPISFSEFVLRAVNQYNPNDDDWDIYIPGEDSD